MSHVAAAPAAPLQRIRAQAVFETRTLLSNGEQLLVSLVLPALALVGLVRASFPDLGPEPRVDVATPGVLALAVVSTAFTGQAIATAFDRRYGLLRLLGVTPLGPRGLLAGKAAAVGAVLLVQLAVLGALGLALGWRPAWSGLPGALLLVALGAYAFVCLALTLAGAVRAEGCSRSRTWCGCCCSSAAACCCRAGCCPPRWSRSPRGCPPARSATDSARP
ncbi:hypothetical protein [Barrientosiimonas endolithica]|uniref:ABC-2 type transport system permease protein n=1 Tax=Barrientosiimonas endolithica TaxID=1535208 RepID=A0ABN6YLC4_9MICO|nr:hypothetical protein GCM10025872_18100 [Barrientosiimonas endolithica]